MKIYAALTELEWFSAAAAWANFLLAKREELRESSEAEEVSIEYFFCAGLGFDESDMTDVITIKNS